MFRHLCLLSDLYFLCLKSRFESEHGVLFGSRRSLMFYSAVPLNTMGTAQPCPVPSLSLPSSDRYVRVSESLLSSLLADTSLCLPTAWYSGAGVSHVPQRLSIRPSEDEGMSINREKKRQFRDRESFGVRDKSVSLLSSFIPGWLNFSFSEFWSLGIL